MAWVYLIPGNLSPDRYDGGFTFTCTVEKEPVPPPLHGWVLGCRWMAFKQTYFWFCMKLISMQGCWVAVCISNGFSLFSLSLFLFSLLLAMKTPRQMSVIFQVSVAFAELKGCSLRSGGGQLPEAEISSFFLKVYRTNLHTGHHRVWIAKSLLKGGLHSSKGHKLLSSEITLCWSVKGMFSEWKLH